MAKLNYVKSARKNIYKIGKQVKAENKRGYRIDRSQPADSEDSILINKGESYYWWKFNFNPHKYISKNSPPRSALTQSKFLSTLWDIQDNLFFNDLNNLESEVEEIISQIQDLLDETQENLDNMPEHLQESSSSGETLTERIENLENWISEIESIDLSVEEDLSDDEKEERLEILNQDLQEILSEL